MGSNCCQEAHHDISSVAIDELKAAVQAESYGEAGNQGANGQLFDPLSAAHENPPLDRHTGSADGKTSFASADTTAETSGEGRLPQFPKEKEAKAKPEANDRAGRIRNLEDRIAGLKAELSVASRQLQAARGDPKTPIWIELRRSDTGNSDNSLLSI
mmetsp:Transcript_116897/g.342317  ORF Transcript_116897/g.342317 Transcript_116897/m.342317 type:complete len:157 (-) Transcript_116897:195-665(-)